MGTLFDTASAAANAAYNVWEAANTLAIDLATAAKAAEKDAKAAYDAWEAAETLAALAGPANADT